MVVFWLKYTCKHSRKAKWSLITFFCWSKCLLIFVSHYFEFSCSWLSSFKQQKGGNFKIIFPVPYPIIYNTGPGTISWVLVGLGYQKSWGFPRVLGFRVPKPITTYDLYFGFRGPLIKFSYYQGIYKNRVENDRYIFEIPALLSCERRNST